MERSDLLPILLLVAFAVPSSLSHSQKDFLADFLPDHLYHKAESVWFKYVMLVGQPRDRKAHLKPSEFCRMVERVCSAAGLDFLRVLFDAMATEEDDKERYVDFRKLVKENRRFAKAAKETTDQDHAFHLEFHFIQQKRARSLDQWDYLSHQERDRLRWWFNFDDLREMTNRSPQILWPAQFVQRFFRQKFFGETFWDRLIDRTRRLEQIMGMDPNFVGTLPDERDAAAHVLPENHNFARDGLDAPTTRSYLARHAAARAQQSKVAPDVEEDGGMEEGALAENGDDGGEEKQQEAESEAPKVRFADGIAAGGKRTGIVLPTTPTSPSPPVSPTELGSPSNALNPADLQRITQHILDYQRRHGGEDNDDDLNEEATPVASATMAGGGGGDIPPGRGQLMAAAAQRAKDRWRRAGAKVVTQQRFVEALRGRQGVVRKRRNTYDKLDAEVGMDALLGFGASSPKDGEPKAAAGAGEEDAKGQGEGSLAVSVEEVPPQLHATRSAAALPPYRDGELPAEVRPRLRATRSMRLPASTWHDAGESAPPSHPPARAPNQQRTLHALPGRSHDRPRFGTTHAAAAAAAASRGEGLSGRGERSLPANRWASRSASALVTGHDGGSLLPEGGRGARFSDSAGRVGLGSSESVSQEDEPGASVGLAGQALRSALARPADEPPSPPATLQERRNRILRSQNGFGPSMGGGGGGGAGGGGGGVAASRRRRGASRVHMLIQASNKPGQ